MTTGRLQYDWVGWGAIGPLELTHAVYIHDGFVFTVDMCSYEMKYDVYNKRSTC